MTPGKRTSVGGVLDDEIYGRDGNDNLIGEGGNDYLDGRPRRQFAEQLETIVARLAATGCRLVIVEVPTGIIWDPYAGIYRLFKK